MYMILKGDNTYDQMRSVKMFVGPIYMYLALHLRHVQITVSPTSLQKFSNCGFGVLHNTGVMIFQTSLCAHYHQIFSFCE